MIDKEIARRQASKKFGDVFFWWYAIPTIAGKVGKAVCLMALAVGLLMGALYTFNHAGEWVAWLGFIVTHYLIPMLLVALGVSAYAIAAVIFWRLNGWKWKLTGFSTMRYSFTVMALLIICMTLVGVTTI